MTKRITKIPATIDRFTSVSIDKPVKRKVAAYARVSTDKEEQLTSYAAQINYYTEYIKSRDEWEFAGVYTDEGITACNTRKRDGFRKMIEDALDNKIDLIITKSVSRFARNTVDSLSTIRKLKEHNVECFFEKENIWTFDGKGELLITIMSSISQEESRSISENVIWGHRKRMADGKVSMAYSRFIGYDKGPDGKLVINPKQAETVRLIFRLFLEGMSAPTIAKRLSDLGIKTAYEKDKWEPGCVRSILKNEKYKGDALLQKSYTVDFLSKKVKKNDGEVPMYYIENDHEPIIDPVVFDIVQKEIEKRKTEHVKYSGVSAFSSKIKCGQCGSWYGSKVWHSTDKYRKVVYQCNHKYNNQKCLTPHLTEQEIKKVFLDAINTLLKNKDEISDNIKTICNMLCDTTVYENKKQEYQNEMERLADEIETAMYENAQTAIDQNEYRRKNNELAIAFDTAKDKYEEIEKQISEIMYRKQKLQKFLETIDKMEDVITEFDLGMWAALVENITVYENGEKKVTFRDGTVI